MKVPFTIYSELLPWPPSFHPSHFQNHRPCNPISQVPPLLKTLQWDSTQRKVKVLTTGLQGPSLMSDFRLVLSTPDLAMLTSLLCPHAHRGPVLSLSTLRFTHMSPFVATLFTVQSCPTPHPHPGFSFNHGTYHHKNLIYEHFIYSDRFYFESVSLMWSGVFILFAVDPRHLEKFLTQKNQSLNAC